MSGRMFSPASTQELVAIKRIVLTWHYYLKPHTALQMPKTDFQKWFSILLIFVVPYFLSAWNLFFSSYILREESDFKHIVYHLWVQLLIYSKLSPHEFLVKVMHVWFKTILRIIIPYQFLYLRSFCQTLFCILYLNYLFHPFEKSIN